MTITDRIRAPRSILLATVAITGAFAGQLAWAQDDSPFAGGETTPRSSAELDFASPEYIRPNTAIQAPVVGLSASTRGATALSRTLATGLEGSLPQGITLIESESDASRLTMGATPTAAPLSPLGEDIDTEQAAELDDTIDAEQVGDLGDGPTPPAQDKVIVHYPVAFQGIPVSKYADVTAFADGAGRVTTVRTRNLPESLDSETPTITAEEALQAAIADAGEWANDAEVEGPVLEVWVSPDRNGRLSYRVELTDNGETPQARRYWIEAAGEGAEVIYWESMILHQHSGMARGTVWDGAGTPTGPTSGRPVDMLEVDRSTGDSELTNEHGFYAFTSGGGNATMSADLSGPNSVIQTMEGSLMSRSGAGAPSDSVDLNFNAGSVQDLAQVTAFYWTNRAHELASDILDPTDLPQLPTIVNRPGSCNAFWNGSSINFYRAGGSCPNMAYDSVVLHEFGHGVDARKGGILHGGYSEGFGDAMSVLGTKKSCVGADFFGPGTCLRDAADVITWPPAPSDGVHAQGRRYAGFAWELTQQLANVYSEETAFQVARDLIMGAAKANPSDIPDAVLLSFVVDDDDGDLTNGTPHFAQLAAAADSRNLPRPADPIRGVRRMGFAWAHHPTAANYAPSATYAHNSANGPIQAQRVGTGTYTMNFAGLGGAGRAGGNVQVTGYGNTRNDCKVIAWSSSGADFRASVRCLAPNGAAVDDRYTILVTWP